MTSKQYNSFQKMAPLLEKAPRYYELEKLCHNNTKESGYWILAGLIFYYDEETSTFYLMYSDSCDDKWIKFDDADVFFNDSMNNPKPIPPEKVQFYGFWVEGQNLPKLPKTPNFSEPIEIVF